MDIVIYTGAWERFINLPPDQMFWAFLGNFGWLIIAVIFLLGVREVYLVWIRLQWEKNHKFVLLAIDIPRGNEQSPKAVENMFTYLAGAHGSVNFFEKWFEGIFQKSFSYEVVSIEGYTQFLIRTPIEFRNLVESSVYSQYPDAEISEVDDYVEAVPAQVPDDEYDLWGAEFIQKDSWVYPIKCYQEFEHQMGPSETQFKDPMASLMDLCGSLRQGEQLWFQIIVVPIGFDWVKESEKEINKIFGRKAKTGTGLDVRAVTALGDLSEVIYPIWGDIDSSDKKEDKPKTMMDLTPGEKRKVEAIQIKASKLSFEAKFRVVYLAKKDVMNKAKVANGIVGFMKQFAALDLNNLKPDVDMTMTKTQYFRKAPRLLDKKRKLFKAYINRSDSRGRNPGVYNIEELATVWHFPIEANVKAAMMQKAPGKKADAPSSLPVEMEKTVPLADIFQDSVISDKAASVRIEDFANKDAAPPENLPTA
ncbi:TPA: hypothetical protein DCZ15_01135 [Candidatus Falkowbacteria bacterium]|nr:MAG: hypothetical protein UV95_C0003G0090 [Candidatus Falkowbacteria bacterium GW2011_GWF2_43_32]HBA36460.1 hypothetical protein [Candidatus Falkowbacteria bacterium]